MRFVSGKDNLADIFTKSPSFLLQRRKLLLDTSPKSLKGDVSDRGDSTLEKLKKVQND